MTNDEYTKRKAIPTGNDASALFVPQAQKPETEKPWNGVGVPTQEEREQREAERRAEKAADIRAKALELAAVLYSVPRSEILILPVNVFILADECARYIQTGEHPA